MRVRLRDEGRIFSGTAKEIIQGMKQTAVFAAHLSLDEYVTWSADNAAQLGITVKIAGNTVEERCASLLDQMLSSGFAELRSMAAPDRPCCGRSSACASTRWPSTARTA